jgi:acyl-CoA dehydrogenase
MAWDFSTDAEFQEKLDWMKVFVREEIEPINILWPDLHHSPPAPWMKKIIDPLKREVKRRGLWAAHLGPELGGTGYGQVKLAQMNEIVGPFWWAQTIFGIQGPDTSNAVVLARYGTQEQKDRYLKPLLEGEVFSCFSMTEPQAGADPSQFRTRAVRDGDNWILNGEKFYSSNANHSAFLLVVAITDPEVSVHKGASIFLVPRDTHGVEILRPTENMGEPEEGTAFGHPHVRYNNVRLPATALLGREGGGFEVAQARLSNGRIYHSARTIGICQRALDMMCERALSRTTAGSLLSEKQNVQQAIANSYAEIQQFRLLVLYTAWQIDQGGGYTPKLRQDIAMCKTLAYKLHHEVVERAVHIHGALGCSNEMPLGKMWMEAPTQGVMDGPYEVHQIVAAKAILKGYKPAEGMWPTEWLPAKRELARAKFATALAEESVYKQTLAATL